MINKAQLISLVALLFAATSSAVYAQSSYWQYASADAYCNSLNPSTNFGSSVNLFIGNSSSNGYHLSVLRFPNITSIPSGSTNISATLNLRSIYRIGNVPTIYVFRVTSNWNESTVTYSSIYTSSTTTGAASASIAAPPGNVSVDISNIVSYWVANPTQEFGVMIRESATSGDNWVSFHSKEATGTTNDPYLSVTYTSPGINLTQGTPVTISADPTLFNVSPQSLHWNVVALTGTSSTDWNMMLPASGGPISNSGLNQCDFLIADGGAGAITGNNGQAFKQISYSGNGVIEHAAPPKQINTPVGPYTSVQLDSFAGGHIVRTAEIYVYYAGPYRFFVGGQVSSGLRWYVFRPTTTSGWAYGSTATWPRMYMSSTTFGSHVDVDLAGC